MNKLVTRRIVLVAQAQHESVKRLRQAYRRLLQAYGTQEEGQDEDKPGGGVVRSRLDTASGAGSDH